MHREIKFRAWSGEEMFDWENMMCSYNQSLLKEGFEDYRAVMQYTGLKDKNGKEIYEGDILKYMRDIGAVTYEGTEFVAISKKDLDWCNLLMPECEVIGNIYENPELLK